MNTILINEHVIKLQFYLYEEALLDKFDHVNDKLEPKAFQLLEKTLIALEIEAWIRSVTSVMMSPLENYEFGDFNGNRDTVLGGPLSVLLSKSYQRTSSREH